MLSPEYVYDRVACILPTGCNVCWRKLAVSNDEYVCVFRKLFRTVGGHELPSETEVETEVDGLMMVSYKFKLIPRQISLSTTIRSPHASSPLIIFRSKLHYH